MEPVSTGAGISKAGSSAILKVLGWGAGQVLQRRALAQYARELEEQDVEQLSPDFEDCPPEELLALGKFVQSAEFDNLALKVTVNAIRYRSGRRIVSSLEQLEFEMRHCLRLHASAIDSGRVYKFSGLLIAALDKTIRESLSKTPLSRTLGRKNTARILKSIPIEAASKRNGDLLQRIQTMSGIAEFETDIREQVRALHSKMKLPHAGDTRLVPYEDLFVEPSLQMVPPPSVEGDSEQLEEVHTLGRNVRLKLSQLVARSLRSVILGDPGGGKSTLSQKLARDIAAGNAARTVPATIPFVVVLRDFAHQFQNSRKTIAQHLQDLCAHPYNISVSEDTIEYVLLNGKAIVIFDGLDELIDTSLRGQVVDAVHAFANRYPTAHVLVTSRRIGYEQVPLDPDLFHAAHLDKFNDEDVKSYAKKWFALDRTILPHQRIALTTAFIRDSTIVADLRVNPLMLSLMCSIYSVDSYIPRNRPDVYEKCATMLFERWDQQRNIHVPLRFDAHIKAALYALALWLYEEPSRQGGLTKEALVSFMRDYLHGRRFELLEDAEDAACGFVEFCTGRAWVMTDVGSNPSQPLYGFTHRTFLEYFAAMQLVRQNREPAHLFGVLAGKIARAEWDVVAQLALQISSAFTEDGADKFLGLLVESTPGMPNADRNNAAFFAGRALNYVIPRPTLIRRIVYNAYQSYLDMEDESRNRMRALVATMASAHEILRLVSDSMTDILRVDVEKHSEPALALALDIEFAASNFGREGFYMHPTNLKHWQDVGDALREELAPIIKARYGDYDWLTMYAMARGYIMPSIAMGDGISAFFSDVGIHLGKPDPCTALYLLLATCPSKERSAFSNHFDLDTLDKSGAFVELVDILLRAPRPWFDFGTRLVAYGFHWEESAVIFGSRSREANRETDRSLEQRSPGATEALVILAACNIETRMPRFVDRRLDGSRFGVLINVLQNCGVVPAKVRFDRDSITETLRDTGMRDSTVQFIASWMSGAENIVGFDNRMTERE